MYRFQNRQSKFGAVFCDWIAVQGDQLLDACFSYGDVNDPIGQPKLSFSDLEFIVKFTL